MMSKQNVASKERMKLHFILNSRDVDHFPQRTLPDFSHEENLREENPSVRVRKQIADNTVFKGSNTERYCEPARDWTTFSSPVSHLQDPSNLSSITSFDKGAGQWLSSPSESAVPIFELSKHMGKVSLHLDGDHGANDSEGHKSISSARPCKRKDAARTERKRSFVCSKCGFSFGMRSNLKRHILTVHEDRRTFECPFCISTFGLKQNLTIHIRVKHQKKRPFACDICGNSFGYKQVLQNHRRNIHNI